MSLAVALFLATGVASAADPPKSDAVPLDRRPYKIEAHVGIDSEARIDATRRGALLADWRSLVGRFVGAPWELSVVEGDDPLSAVAVESADLEAFAKAGGDADKVWVIRIRRRQAAYELLGREFDTSVQRVGPLRRRLTPIGSDLPRALIQLALDLFAPSAEIGEPSGGGVLVTVRGASLEAASPIGQVAVPGQVFVPLRAVAMPEGKTRILGIPFTYLRVESVSGPVARCAIVSALRDPLTKRIAKKNALLALGIKPGDQPTRLRFVTKPDKIPAAGYVLTARTLPDGPPREVGTTDREGRIVLEPGFADGLVALRLLAGSVEPMVELPLMPGENPDERTIPFEPKPKTVELETELDSLRDAILDLVASRARLEARLKARTDGEDWAGVEETLKEYAKLPPRSKYADRLAKLKEEAALQQAKTKTAILTKTAQAQLADVQALVDRYLDDEVVRGYTEALERAKSEAAAAKKAQAAAAKKGNRRRPASPAK